MVRIQQQPAYVLHARAYRESSLLLELLTRDHGRVALVARGARGPKSRWRNMLQPFRPLLSGWSARGELGTLVAAEQVAAPPAIHGEALYCGLYLNELLVRLLHRGDPHPEVFERYRAVLADLSAQAAPQPLLRVFEKHLLDAVGYGLILDVEGASGQSVRPDIWYDYRTGVGPVALAEAPSGRRFGVPGAALLALAEDRVPSEFSAQLRQVTRHAIAHAIGDKPLKSRALFKN